MNDPKQGRPPLPSGEAATGQIQLRVKMARKNAYVKAAQKAGKKLTEWIFDLCDRSSNYKDG